jgi:glycosyltransferase involved in cell wall biosynthesis
MTALRVLIAHARYRQRGGEDAVAESETQLLKSHGHAVASFTRDNKDIDDNKRFAAVLRTLWSQKTTAELSRLLEDFQPDVIHVHNTFPSISPSLYWVAARYGIPIVQTLHNFRMLCPQAMLLRDGRVCEECVGHAPWRAVKYGCYRDSTAHSAVLASMLMTHRSLGTYRKVTRYIALNKFCRNKFIEGGLPADRIVIKPNFADVPEPDLAAPRSGALFAGRLSKEKGIDVLLNAFSLLPYNIQIVGDGPERARLADRPNIATLGWLEPPDLLAAMSRSAYLVLPSIWYENSPRTLIEAFGCGLPVIASKLGALAELVEDGRTGLLFDPNSAPDLARVIRWAEEHPSEMRVMGKEARREFDLRYSPDCTYSQLIAIYREAIEAQYSMEAA